MSWTSWLGIDSAEPNQQEAPARRAPPEVTRGARTPLPKRLARGSGSKDRPPLRRSDEHVPASSQVPKVVVDFEDMLEPTVEPVLIHVYDVGDKIVEYFKARKLSYNPFHTGVEVCGTEYSFGLSISTNVAEVLATTPQKHLEHKLRLTLSAGYTSVPPRDVLRRIKAMDAEWNNNTFNWKSRNGHHFSDALLGHLGVRRCPAWLHEDHGCSQPVFLKVYHLGQTFITRWLNKATDAAASKSYGAYHTGVEVYGREWAFGVPGDEYTSAIGWCPPGECDVHDFKENVFMGSTILSARQVEAIVAEMSLEWTGDKYDMFTRNCHNFSQAFCRRLGLAAETPSWINELAEALAPAPESRSGSKEDTSSQEGRD